MIASDSHFSGRGSQKVAKVLPITDLRTLCYGTEKKRAARRSPVCGTGTALGPYRSRW